MEYIARFEPDGDGFIVTFPAFAEANTGGANIDEAIENAIDALEVVVLTYVKDGRDLPPADGTLEQMQADAQGDDNGAKVFRFPVSAFALAKMALIREFRASGLSQVAFAKKLNKAETEARRMLDPYHATKLSSIDQGLRVLGKKLVLSVEDLPDRAA